MKLDEYYPVVIREARYGEGVYAGAPWVCIAGLHNVDVIDAFAGDGPCHSFWCGLEPPAMIRATNQNGREVDVIVATGDTPNAAFARAEAR